MGYRGLYQTFLQEFMIDTQKLSEETGDSIADPLGACTSTSPDGTRKDTSKWDMYFKENETLSQIHKVPELSMPLYSVELL